MSESSLERIEWWRKMFDGSGGASLVIGGRMLASVEDDGAAFHVVKMTPEQALAFAELAIAKFGAKEAKP